MPCGAHVRAIGHVATLAGGPKLPLSVAVVPTDGGEIPGMIISFDEDEVMVDFNHPLSGRTILFDVLIHRVEPAELH